MMQASSLRNGIFCVLAAFSLTAPVSASKAADQAVKTPVIQNYGALRADTDVGELPDLTLRYRVVFEITRSASEAGAVNPALDRLARFVNLLGAAGIRPKPGDIVAVIHGAATPTVLADPAYEARFNRPNPDAALIQALARAGVAVHVCSYALGNQNIAHADVAQGIKVDLAAMMTLANLQLKGWALIAG